MWYRIRVGKLYQLECEPVSAEHASVALKQHSDLGLWHQRLGHLNAQGSHPEEISEWCQNSENSHVIFL